MQLLIVSAANKMFIYRIGLNLPDDIEIIRTVDLSLPQFHIFEPQHAIVLSTGQSLIIAIR